MIKKHLYDMAYLVSILFLVSFNIVFITIGIIAFVTSFLYAMFWVGVLTISMTLIFISWWIIEQKINRKGNNDNKETKGNQHWLGMSSLWFRKLTRQG